MSNHHVVVLLVLTLWRTCSASNSLYFRACTPDKNRILLCINECESDVPTEDEDFYSTRQIVLDLTTGKVSIPGVGDDPIFCPNYDQSITPQPRPSINVNCTNISIHWYLTDDYGHSFNVQTAAEESSSGPLWYNAFFFITTSPSRLFFVIEGSNHVYHNGLAIDLESEFPHLRWNWTTGYGDGVQGFNPEVMTSVQYEEDRDVARCVIQKQKEGNYPILFESLSLLAFPDSKTSMWYKFDDTGLYRFAPSGLLDNRLNAIISIEGMIVTIHYLSNVAGEDVKTFYLEKQVEEFRVSRPLALRPSVVIFSVSLVVTVVLVVAEVISKQRVPTQPSDSMGPGHVLGHGDGTNIPRMGILPFEDDLDKELKKRSDTDTSGNNDNELSEDDITTNIRKRTAGSGILLSNKTKKNLAREKKKKKYDEVEIALLEDSDDSDTKVEDGGEIL